MTDRWLPINRIAQAVAARSTGLR